jgi:hypothetical protein
MTEQEWLTGTDPIPMLAFLQGKASDRKLRLFACAVCRDWFVWELWLRDERSRKAVEVAERFVDGEASEDELEAARRAAWTPIGANFDIRGFRLAIAAWATTKDGFQSAEKALRGFHRNETAFLCGLFREIFGNPFRPSVDLSPSILAWNDGTVRRLARGIYAEQAFGRLSILADALEEAGCTDTGLLEHCRYEGPPPVVPGPEFSEPADVRSHSRSEVAHTRGCWAVDLILGQK